MFFLFLRSPTTYLILSIVSMTKPVRTMNSIAIDFPILVVDEFLRWVELEDLSLVRFFFEVGLASF